MNEADKVKRLSDLIELGLRKGSSSQEYQDANETFTADTKGDHYRATPRKVRLARLKSRLLKNKRK